MNRIFHQFAPASKMNYVEITEIKTKAIFVVRENLSFIGFSLVCWSIQINYDSIQPIFFHFPDQAQLFSYSLFFLNRKYNGKL